MSQWPVWDLWDTLQQSHPESHTDSSYNIYVCFQNISYIEKKISSLTSFAEDADLGATDGRVDLVSEDSDGYAPAMQQ